MKIEELKPSRQVQGRWLAVLEDGSILRLGEGEVVDFALFAGKELTEREAEGLTAAARKTGWKEKALSLLARKPQSRGELERKLAEWGAGSQEAGDICDRLEELGYLNDAAYQAQQDEQAQANWQQEFNAKYPPVTAAVSGGGGSRKASTTKDTVSDVLDRINQVTDKVQSAAKTPVTKRKNQQTSKLFRPVSK